MTSRRLIAAWPRSFIPISTPGTRRRKSASKKFQLPMVCSSTRINAPVMTGARSTPAAPNNRGSVFYKDFASEAAAGNPYENYSGFADFADSDEVLSELLRRSARVRARGADVRYHLPIEFLEAVTGATKRLTLPDGETLDVTIPAGIQNGQVLRLRGKGRPGIGD